MKWAHTAIRKNTLRRPPPPYPDAYFQRCCLLVAFDHGSGQAALLLNEEGEKFLSPKHKQWAHELSQKSFWEGLTEEAPASHPAPHIDKPFEQPAEYEKKILAAKELIYAGEIYQVNLSQQLLCSGEIDAFSLFHTLALTNPALFPLISIFLN